LQLSAQRIEVIVRGAELVRETSEARIEETH
jgi:hypothetical protein